MTELNKDRLGKLVAMAQKGEGNEQQIAIRKVKLICKQHNLNFDEVMGGGSEERHEYTIKYRTTDELKVLSQIVARYAQEKQGTTGYNRMRKVVFFTTTREKYIEVLNAWSVLRRLYKNEEIKVKKAMFYGFLEKHDLFYKPTPEEREEMMREQNEDVEDQKARRMGSALADGMETAHIHKQLQ